MDQNWGNQMIQSLWDHIKNNLYNFWIIIICNIIIYIYTYIINNKWIISWLFFTIWISTDFDGAAKALRRRWRRLCRHPSRKEGCLRHSTSTQVSF